jgi:hypothetical protein
MENKRYMDGGVYKINSVGHILFFIEFVFLDIHSLSNYYSPKNIIKRYLGDFLLF